MSTVKGFRGFRYNPEKVDKIVKVLAPPYDVISPEEQSELYSDSPYNVVRLILSKFEGEKKYHKAAETLKEWINEEVLIQDSEPSIYPYHQEFKVDGKIIRRRGFIAIVKLEEFSSQVILPHERTFSKPKLDRLKLTLACKANLSPVFSIYSDPNGLIEKAMDEKISQKPLIDSTYKDGVRNMLWQTSDSDLMSEINKSMLDLNLLIADGHHRYETALEYRNIQRGKFEKPAGDEPYEYVMMCLSRAEDEGLIIDPTHRLLKNIDSMVFMDFLQKVSEMLKVEKINVDEASTSIGSQEFVILSKDSNSAYKVSPKKLSPETYKNLGVMLLHNVVFKEIISEEKSKILYTKSIKEVTEFINKGEYNLGFILPPISALDIFEIVLSNEKLPHKTTYFYPKILSGLVFNPLW